MFFNMVEMPKIGSYGNSQFAVVILIIFAMSYSLYFFFFSLLSIYLKTDRDQGCWTAGPSHMPSNKRLAIGEAT